jgi:phospholipase/carboxylesterase
MLQPLGGLVILSSFVGPSDDLTPAKLPGANFTIPFFWGHGQADPVVPFGFGKVGADQLKQVRAEDDMLHPRPSAHRRLASCVPVLTLLSSSLTVL